MDTAHSVTGITKPRLENIFSQLWEICTDVPTWIRKQADLRNHQEEAPVALEADFKLIQEGKGVPRKQRSSRVKVTQEADHKLGSLNRCSVKKMVGKEDPAVLTCQQLWSHSLDKADSNSTVKQLSCQESKMTTRIYVEGNTLSQEQRSKEDGLIWHLQVLGLRVQERPHGILSSWPARTGTQTSRAAAGGEFHPLADPYSEEFLKRTQIDLDFSYLTLSNSLFCSGKIQRGGLPSVPCMKPLREDTLQL